MSLFKDIKTGLEQAIQSEKDKTDKTLIKEANKRLCEKYPFLIPSNRWTGKRVTDGHGFWSDSPDSVPEYDWEYIELDDMPDGWRIAFGEQLCEELKAELERAGVIDSYRITQIKEKYGSLRWYDNGNTKEEHAVIGKYVDLSMRTCICCGRPATRVSLEWVSPYCNDCLPKSERSLSIDEYYSNNESEDLI